MCVCWEGHGRVFPLDHLLPNPTNLPSISIPSRKKIRDFLSCHELRYGSVIMKWIKKKNNTPGCRHREQTYGQNGGKGWKVGGKTKKEGTYVCLWLIHVDIWQRPTQYCKVIFLQFKINVIDAYYKTEKKMFGKKPNTPELLHMKGCVSASLNYLDGVCLPSKQ